MENKKNPFTIKIPNENNANPNPFGQQTNSKTKENINNQIYIFKDEDEIQKFIGNLNIFLVDILFKFKTEMETFYSKIENINQELNNGTQPEELEEFKIFKNMIYYKNMYAIVLHEAKKFLIDVFYDMNLLVQKLADMEEITTNEIATGVFARGNQTKAMDILTKANNEAVEKLSADPTLFSQIISFKFVEPNVAEVKPS